MAITIGDKTHEAHWVTFDETIDDGSGPLDAAAVGRPYLRAMDAPGDRI